MAAPHQGSGERLSAFCQQAGDCVSAFNTPGAPGLPVRLSALRFLCEGPMLQVICILWVV